MSCDILEINDSVDNTLSISRAPIPGTKRYVSLWTNKEKTKFQVLRSDINSLKKVTDLLPQVVKDKIADQEGDVNLKDCIDHLKQDDLIDIPLPVHGDITPIIIKGVLEHEYPADCSYKILAVFSAVFSALMACGGSFQQVITDNLPHSLLTIHGWHSKIPRIALTGNCSPSTLLNTALMGVCMIGKTVHESNFEEFQKRRFKTCCQDANLNFDLPPPIKLNVLTTMSRCWPMFQDFINGFIERLLIKSATGLTTIEQSIVTQAKLVLENSQMVTFIMATKLANRFLTPEFFVIEKFKQDFVNGFKDAVIWYTKQPAERRPYLRLLKTSGFDALFYRRYNSVYYAATCFIKLLGDEQGSIQNMITEALGLDQSDKMSIKKAVAISIARNPTIASISQIDMEKMKAEFGSVLSILNIPVPENVHAIEPAADVEKRDEYIKLMARSMQRPETRAIEARRMY